MLMLFVLPCNVITESNCCNHSPKNISLSNPLCLCVRVSTVEGYCTVCAAFHLKMNRWKKLAKLLKVSSRFSQQLTDAQGTVRVQLCHLSLPSASGPEAVRILPVECGLSATNYADTVLYIFYSLLYIIWIPVTRQRNPVPDSGGVQYDTQCQKLWLIFYVFASPYGIHIKHESMLTRFKKKKMYTERFYNPWS